MSVYLNSYHPLAKYSVGLARALAKSIPPFVDASCRREPDFECEYPSITALCRGRLFAPRLRKDDVVVYTTVKDEYFNADFPHWRLCAILRVLERFQSHTEAADWYRKEGLRLPSNCMVRGNRPLPSSWTAYTNNGCNIVGNADRDYQKRAKDCGVFLVCEALYLELDNPAIITDLAMYEVFKKIPRTRIPPSIKAHELRALVKKLGVANQVKNLDLICPE